MITSKYYEQQICHMKFTNLETDQYSSDSDVPITLNVLNIYLMYALYVLLLLCVFILSFSGFILNIVDGNCLWLLRKQLGSIQNKRYSKTPLARGRFGIWKMLVLASVSSNPKLFIFKFFLSWWIFLLIHRLA